MLNNNDFRPKNDNSLIGNILIVVLVVFICFVIYKMTDIASKVNTDIKTIKNNPQLNIKPAKPNLQVTKSIVCPVDNFGTPGVCGIVKNNTSRMLSYVQIDINLYDAHNNLIATAVDNINNLPAGGTWQFMARPLTFNILPFRSYEIVNVSGW